MNFGPDDDTSTTTEPTAIDLLLSYKDREVVATTTVSHPDLTGLRFVAEIPRDGDEMYKLATKAAAKEKVKLDDLPVAIVARWQLAASVIRIEVFRGGEWQPVEIDGDIVTFASPELTAQVGAKGMADTVWKLIKDDGIVAALVGKIGESSNFGTQATREDPTTAL